MATGQLAITPRAAQATAGDDWRLGLTLWSAGAVKDVSLATSVQAAVRSSAGCTVIAATAQSSGTTGAAWATGVVVVAFTAAQTAALSRGDYCIELEVVLGGVRTTWPLVPVAVTKAVIP